MLQHSGRYRRCVFVFCKQKRFRRLQKCLRFQNEYNKVEIELRVVQFWTEIKLVTTNRTHASRPCDFVITRLISVQIALHFENHSSAADHMTAIIFLAQNNPILILTCRLNVWKEAKSFVRLLRIFYPAKPFIPSCRESSTILVFWKVCICTLTGTLCNDMISCCSIGGHRWRWVIVIIAEIKWLRWGRP
jgi:hypothetical protein